MKYANFNDDFLSYFRLDDNGETLVLTDKRGYTRAVKLLPYDEKPKYFPPCEDCNKKMEEIRQAYDKMKSMERPQGEWVVDAGGYQCNKCFAHALEINGIEIRSNFCPNCGADMRKGGAE